MQVITIITWPWIINDLFSYEMNSNDDLSK